MLWMAILSFSEERFITPSFGGGVARGGEYYVDELCPQRTSGIADIGKATVPLAV